MRLVWEALLGVLVATQGGAACCPQCHQPVASPTVVVASDPTPATQTASPRPPKRKRRTQPVQPARKATDCVARLRDAGVAFSSAKGAQMATIETPLVLKGKVGGVSVRARNGRPTVVACRLAEALLDWAPALRRAGVRDLVHVSTFRPGARIRRSGRVSAHARAMAFDLYSVGLADGSRQSVLEDWGNATQGRAPCKDGQREVLRRLVCDAAKQRRFQTLLTPHYNRDHRDHVHLELNPGQRTPFLR